MKLQCRLTLVILLAAFSMATCELLQDAMSGNRDHAISQGNFITLNHHFKEIKKKEQKNCGNVC